MLGGKFFLLINGSSHIPARLMGQGTSTGEITNMTGISAPYEEPVHPSLIINTDKLGLQQCVDEVISFLLKQGLIMKKESSV